MYYYNQNIVDVIEFVWQIIGISSLEYIITNSDLGNYSTNPISLPYF